MINENIPRTSSGYGPGMEEQNHGGAGLEGIKGMASQAGEKLMDTAEHQKQAGADVMSGVADAVRRAAGEFDGQVPQAAQYIRLAADQMETMTDSLRRRDIRQMMFDVQSFVRQQPAAFLGASLIAGFAAMRFLRSTSLGARGSTAAGGGRGADEPGYESRYEGSAAAMRSPGMGSAMPHGSSGFHEEGSPFDDGRYGAARTNPTGSGM